MRFIQEHRTLTGRMRIRPNWYGRLIPQVQVLVKRGQVGLPVPPPPTMSDEAERVAWRKKQAEPETVSEAMEWRDATWLDLQELPRFTVGTP